MLEVVLSLVTSEDFAFSEDDSDEEEGEGISYSYLENTISDCGAVESLATVVELTSDPQAQTYSCDQLSGDKGIDQKPSRFIKLLNVDVSLVVIPQVAGFLFELGLASYLNIENTNSNNCG